MKDYSICFNRAKICCAACRSNEIYFDSKFTYCAFKLREDSTHSFKYQWFKRFWFAITTKRFGLLFHRMISTMPQIGYNSFKWIQMFTQFIFTFSRFSWINARSQWASLNKWFGQTLSIDKSQINRRKQCKAFELSANLSFTFNLWVYIDP